MNTEHFGRHRRKIMPAVLPDHPGDAAGYEALSAYATEKASALNRHVLGYGELAETEWSALALAAPDLDAVREYRLQRIRQQLQSFGLSAAILCDPLNVRYATDSTNMQVWSTHNAVRYTLVTLNGPVIAFDFHNCEHLSAHNMLVDEVRHGVPWFYFESGPRSAELAQKWADELADLIKTYCGPNARIAVDKCRREGVAALQGHGLKLHDGEEVMELARAVKCSDEIKAMRRSIAACEAAMSEMEAALRPGMTEWDLWALLHAGNIRRGGEWIETHLLASGPRTNPWFQEASAREIQSGELVAFDTDLVGPYGMCCDISRTWLCGDGQPTNEQRSLYQMAVDQIEANIEMLAPGRSFHELSHSAKNLPEDYQANRYSVLFHGVGLCDEYPAVPYPADWASGGYDGVLVPGMVVCVESYVGRHGGHEGVKLEEQLLITETGYERLSTYPYDARLMGRQI
ncbi:M24 family metallopeptidase [Roseibium alexandrii]|uniref:Xaa-Pro aminopeptidase n=1 Tax=Roseibium alexandrii (strain DSM 17067 / NCIMB 14079 / DFL-11) TaxID=244592 RepID=A0A5E8GU93_ROSAD|nr:Xaa-Pro peptidase family protein [Roseibium alexandrii]EEE43511.1 Xaa-Pro aminopeptidase [Roseibium alexandrii DFL-11]